MAECRSCGASIRWVLTEGGKHIPVDREPVPDGNVVPVIQDGRWVAHVLATDEPWEDGNRYVAHFATCPQADKWRKR